MNRRTAAVLVLASLLVALPTVFSQEEKSPPSEDLVTFEVREGGWTMEDLFRKVAEISGESICYDPDSPGISGRRVEFVGEQKVPRARVFEWFQSILSFQRIVLVPVLGGDWVAMDAQSPQIGIRPIFVPEADLSEWKDRRGVYILTTVTLPRDVDADQAVEQLGLLVSAEVGHFNRVVTGPTIVIGDYAPRVVALARLARRFSTERTARLDRYEERLANSTTETAARYFTTRIADEFRSGRRAGGK